jgi:type VI secretion system ImpA family protein
MPTDGLLNLEQLLAPISEAEPTGPNVHGVVEEDRYDPVSRIQLRHFRGAKDWQDRYRKSCLRGYARPAQEDGANWRTVSEHATTCLTSRSKDLWACAYLLVAVTYRHGVAGLAQGLGLMAELLKRYGTQLHPAKQPLSELRKAVPDIEDAVKFAPLTDKEHGNRSHWDFIIASEISMYAPEQLAPYLELNTPLAEQLRSELAESSPEHLQRTAAEIQQCEEGLTALDQEIRAKFPDAANEYPNFEAIRNELKACRGIIEPYLTTQDQAEAGDGSSAPLPLATADAAPQNRQKALHQLEEIAAYFERIEPLSPLPYVIRRAVAWGKMSLPEVLAELLSEEERNKLKERAGIPMHIPPQ